ncbi:MAG TPA: type II toxin-antitoxin system prevent-host-death family antitoxin [Actinobacteria bacterium]|jgi:prevent-host-death family protein|nr:type II toxin-antitoxin system prevent-host-death family antitoxin [Actinomycetota bacterium]
MANVGVRELQQHASAVVRRASAGEDIGITDRGRLVARLVPVTSNPLEQMIEAGQARPATRTVAQMAEPLPASGRRSLSDLLAEQRTDER